MTQESRLVISVDSRNAKPNVDALSAAMRALENAGVRVTRSNSDVPVGIMGMSANRGCAERNLVSK